MASFGTYLLHTNHLSARELYEYLYNDGCERRRYCFLIVFNGCEVVSMLL